MKSALSSALTILALSAAASAAQATVYQFNAALKGSNENPPTAATATGVATLFYDDHGTASLGDDTFDFAMSVFGLSGGTTPGTAANDWHIHAAATLTENAPVLISLKNAPFVSLNSGSTLLVGGDDVAVPSVPATPVTGTNAGHPAMSFLATLQGGLAYVNVHTAANGSGAVRGQLIQVAVVPEPSSYALLLAGLGVIGLVVRRRR